MTNSKTTHKVADALATTVIPLEGTRPLLLDRFIEKALLLLGMTATRERVERIRLAIAARSLEELGDLEKLHEEKGQLVAEIESLRRQVAAQTEREQRNGAVLTETEIVQIRTWVEYGMSQEDAARVLGLPTETVELVMERKGHVRFTPRRKVGRPRQKQRVLDLS